MRWHRVQRQTTKAIFTLSTIAPFHMNTAAWQLRHDQEEQVTSWQYWLLVIKQVTCSYVLNSLETSKNRRALTFGNLATNSTKFLGSKWFKIKTFDARTRRWVSCNWCAVGPMCSGLVNSFEHFVCFHRHDVGPPLATARMWCTATKEGTSPTTYFDIGETESAKYVLWNALT